MAEPSLPSNNPFRRKSPAKTTAPGGVSSSEQQSLFPAVPGPSYSSSTSAAPTSSDLFRESLQALPKSTEAPPSTTFQKPKIVKRVRVQSPPPSPSDSSDDEFEARFPAAGPPDDASSGESSSDEDENEEKIDPFGYSSQGPLVAEPTSIGHGSGQTSQGGLPFNPFQRTLKDMEQQSSTDGSQDIATTTTTRTRPGALPAPASKGSLDVSSFGRLLMTGQTGTATVPAANTMISQNTAVAAGGDAGSLTDSSSLSKQSELDPAQIVQDTPRTSHDMSDVDNERAPPRLVSPTQTQTQTQRKKPPPPAPSSRHGRLIKAPSEGEKMQENARPAGTAARSSHPRPPGSRRRTSSSSDMNKPLPSPPPPPPPPPPRTAAEEVASESMLNRKSAEKIPEVDVDPDAPEEDIPLPRPPTPPNASHTAKATSTSTTTITTTTKTPTSLTGTPTQFRPVAPPPRRHARSESKTTFEQQAGPTISSSDHDLEGGCGGGPPRSSFDSQLSRSSSLKAATNAPAPPPPRRPQHNQRPSNSSTSYVVAPPSISSSSASSPNPHPHPPPPPPPPTRGLSIRNRDGRKGNRPPSVSSIDAVSRRVRSNSNSSVAPPPPPPPTRRTHRGSRGAVDAPAGVNDAEKATASSREEVEEEEGEAVVAASSAAAGADILADLDALQREVDAFRGQYTAG